MQHKKGKHAAAKPVLEPKTLPNTKWDEILTELPGHLSNPVYHTKNLGFQNPKFVLSNFMNQFNQNVKPIPYFRPFQKKKTVKYIQSGIINRIRECEMLGQKSCIYVTKLR